MIPPRFHQPRATVVCHIMQCGLSRGRQNDAAADEKSLGGHAIIRGWRHQAIPHRVASTPQLQ
jgi:hypothetical protein